MRSFAAFVLLLAASACAGHDAATPTQVPTAGLTVEPRQYRDDVVADRLQLTVSNRTGSPLVVSSIQLEWAAMTSVPTAHALTIIDGQRVDLPVLVGRATCSIEGTRTGVPPPIDDARAVLTLADGSTRSAAVQDPDDTLTGLFDAACERQMIADQITVEFTDVVPANVDGRPLSVGELTVHRQRAAGEITVLSAGDTIRFRLHFPNATSGGPIVRLPASAGSTSAKVQFLEGRCDAHAVAEAKQPFRFVLQIDLGDGIARPFVVEPHPDLHEGMLAVAASGCEALEATGTLSAGG